MNKSLAEPSGVLVHNSTRLLTEHFADPSQMLTHPVIFSLNCFVSNSLNSFRFIVYLDCDVLVREKYYLFNLHVTLVRLPEWLPKLKQVLFLFSGTRVLREYVIFHYGVL